MALPPDPRWEEQRLFELPAACPGASNVYRVADSELMNQCWADHRPRIRCERLASTSIGLCRYHHEELMDPLL